MVMAQMQAYPIDISRNDKIEKMDAFNLDTSDSSSECSISNHGNGSGRTVLFGASWDIHGRIFTPTESPDGSWAACQQDDP